MVDPSATPHPEGDSPTLKQPAAQGAAAHPAEPAGEQTLWSGRTTWKHYLNWIVLVGVLDVLVWVVLIVIARKTSWTGGAAFWTGLAITAIAAFIVAVRITYLVFKLRYELTTQRLFVERGILSRTRDQTELIRVDDVRVHKSFLDRIVGAGTIEVMSTDATDKTLKIEGVASPDTIAEQVRSRMRTLRSRSLFIENL